MINNITKLISFLSRENYYRLGLVALLLITAGVAEMVTLATSAPFLRGLSGGGIGTGVFSDNLFLTHMSETLNLTKVQSIAIQFCAAFCFASFVRVIIVAANADLSFQIGNTLGELAFSNALRRSYQDSKQVHSSLDVVAITNYVNTVIFSVLFPVVTIITSAVLIVALLSALVHMMGFEVIYGISLIGAIYALLIYGMRNRLTRLGASINQEAANTLRVLQEALASFREIKLGSFENTMIRKFSRHDKELRHSQGTALIYQMTPRYFVEAMAIFLLIMTVILIDSAEVKESNTLIIIGSLLIGLQRLLPNAQQLFQSWASLRTGEEALENIVKSIGSIVTTNSPGNTFASSSNFGGKFKILRFENVSFAYGENEDPIFTNLTLEIKAGSRTGITGPSGGGKSTFVDLLSGLLKPTKGSISIDGIDIWSDVSGWYRRIAYVPQSIHLADTSIRDNIGFGIATDCIDNEQVRRSAHIAGLDPVLRRLSNGIDTLVGEKGGLLSGGERQRVGIARAAYKDADLIIFDEATSALDAESENIINAYIRALDSSVTVVIIAHKQSALIDCDTILRVESGKVFQENPFVKSLK